MRSLATLNWGMSRQQLRNWLDSPRLPDAEDVIAASALAIATVLLIKLVLFLLAFLVRLSLSLRTEWTRRVPHPVLIGHTASFTPY